MSEELDSAVGILERFRVLSAMTTIVGEVYLRNTARHDPALGDDATTFGITTSRNIANLAIPRLRGLPGVGARQVDSALEILCAGYVLRQYKLPGTTLDVSVNAITWDDSEAKLDGAIENSATGQLTLDADHEAGPQAFGAAVPPMRHLRLVHAGDMETGECVVYIGVPVDNRAGGSPWFDVMVVSGDPGGSPGMRQSPDGPAQPDGRPNYDELPLPDIGLAPRRTIVPGQERDPGRAR